MIPLLYIHNGTTYGGTHQKGLKLLTDDHLGEQDFYIWPLLM